MKIITDLPSRSEPAGSLETSKAIILASLDERVPTLTEEELDRWVTALVSDPTFVDGVANLNVHDIPRVFGLSGHPIPTTPEAFGRRIQSILSWIEATTGPDVRIEMFDDVLLRMFPPYAPANLQLAREFSEVISTVASFVWYYTIIGARGYDSFHQCSDK